MDKALKQRLVGASVLIALAVIVLPMLLSGRPESASQQTQKIELPPRPAELSFETRRFPVTNQQGDTLSGQKPRSAAGAKPAGASPDQAGDSQKLPVNPTASAQKEKNVSQQQIDDQAISEQAAPQNSGTHDKPAPNAPADAALPDTKERQQAGRYLVQVASLGSSENASRLAASLQEKSLPVLIDTVDSDTGRLNRVRVGPFENEAEALRVSGQIAEEIAGVSPRIVDLLPDQSDAVPGSTNPLARWVVQVGSFADASNAERLVAQLKADGMSAYRETVTSTSTSIFRVRVGPYLEREDALRAKRVLSERLSIDGVVMSAD
jgi:DedD protein